MQSRFGFFFAIFELRRRSLPNNKTDKAIEERYFDFAFDMSVRGNRKTTDSHIGRLTAARRFYLSICDV